MELNLIIPAGGKSSRYNHGKPKWLRTHPDGDLMIEHAVSALTSKNEKLNIYIITNNEVENKYNVKTFLKNTKLKNLEIILLENETNSSVETIYRGVRDNYKKFNIYEAAFDDEMYSKITVAIIKPGLGTITDCLSRGITLITYTNNQNKEFTENAKILEKNNIGINFYNLTSALNFSMLLIKEKFILKERFKNAKNLIWNGEKEVLKIINDLFSNKLLIYNEKYEQRLKQKKN